MATKALRFAMLCGMSGAMKAPPLTDARRLTLSYKTLATRAAEGVNAAFAAGHRRVSVEIPQISSVDRSTIARRFEDDNNWLLALIAILGSRRPEPIGAQVSIFEGGFEGGGDYLSSEGLYGYRWQTKGSSVTAARAPLPTAPARPARRHLHRRAMQVGNSEVGSTALRDLKALDDGGKLLLFNLGLDRLSIFDRIGLPSFDDVQVAYVCRRVAGGQGFLTRQYPDEWGVWGMMGGAGGARKAAQAPVLLRKAPQPIRPQDAEAAVRSGGR